MENPRFVDEETIPLVQDEDYDDHNTPSRSRIYEKTSFTELATTEATSTLRLNQKVKRDKLAALYRPLNVTGNIGLIDLNRFNLTTDPKKGPTTFEFYNGDRSGFFNKGNRRVFCTKNFKR